MNALAFRPASMLGVVGVVLALAGPAHAITTTGRVDGLVLDPAGLPVHDAEVELSGNELPGGTTTGRADADGAFRWSGLPPGTYAVKVEAAGFRAIHVENVVVSVGRATLVDVVMEPPSASVDKPLVVQAPVRAVDIEQAGLGTTLGQAFLGRTAARRTWLGPALLVAGVQDAPMAGPSAAPGGLVMHGGNPWSNQFFMDGVNVTDPLTGQAPRGLNFDMLQDVEVQTAGREAEMGGATGGVVNAVTRGGGNRFWVDTSVYVRPDLGELSQRRLVSPDARFLPEGVSPFRADDDAGRATAIQGNLNAGGPIIKDRLWLSMSHQVGFSRDSLPSRAAGGRVAPREVRSYWGMARLTYQPASWQRFDLLVMGDPSVVVHALQDRRVHPDAELDRQEGGAVVSLSGETRVGDHVRIRNRLALVSSYLQELPSSGDDSTPPHLDVASGATYGNGPRMYRDARSRLQYSPQVVFNWSMPLGAHETRIGADAYLAWARTWEDVPGGATRLDVGGTPGRAGAPYQEVAWKEPRQSLFTSDSIGLYVQDHWRPIRTVSIRPGVRLDSSRVRDDRAVPPWRMEEGSGSGFTDPATSAGSVLDATVVHFNVLSPRLSVSWDPFADGKTSLHASAARYTDTGALWVAQRTARGPSTTRATWDGASGRYVNASDEPVGGAVASPQMAGPDPRRIPRAEDVDLRRPWAPSVGGWDPLQLFSSHGVPHTDELVAGVSRELVESVSFSANAVLRLSSNLYEARETNLQWNADGTAVVDGRNGTREAVTVVGTPDAAYQVYYGLEFVLRKRLTDKFEGLVSYAFGVNRGTSAAPFSGVLDSPSPAAAAFGPLDFDRRHVLTTAGTYQLPLGFFVGGTFSYLSGRPYNAYRRNNFTGEHSDLVARRGYDPADPRAELRTADTVESALRLAWNAEELNGPRLWLIMDVTNVLNLRGPLAVDQRLGATQGDVTQRQAPVQLNLGLRFQY